MIRRDSSAIPPNVTLRMPAEWEPHEATWLGWPHEVTDWPGKFSPIPWAFAEIVRHLAAVERVYLIVEDRAAETRARATLEKTGAALDAITFFHIPTDRGWMRDSGPIAVHATRGVIPNPSPTLSVGDGGEARLPARQGSAVAFGEENQQQIPRTPGRPLQQPEREAGRPSARDDSPQIGDARELALLNFAFNAWAKYDDWKKDARVVPVANRKLKRHVILPAHKGRRVVLEGGAIDVNGRGTLLTTEECLLSDVQSRNPGFTKFDYAQVFKRYLGVTNTLWLERGIAGDDTHGHIDDLARFIDERTVVAVEESDPASPNYAPLQENLALLRGMKDQDGQPLRVETLPMPMPVYFAGQLLPASYANFYIANKIVLVPVFNDPADRIALNILAALFPDREIVPIYCRDLVLGLGTIHCMTQQLPRIE
jgi:agmatine deiminase